VLEIDVATAESFDDDNNKFLVTASHRVRLEHSLVSVSKWESSTEKVFLSKEAKSQDETVLYIKMMLRGDDPPPEVFQNLLDHHLQEITEYIDAKMSATRIPEEKNQTGKQEPMTSELIYYWMVSMTIPFECQHWHLNRLITLIRVITLKNAPKNKRKRSTAEMMAERRALNNKRLAELNTSG
jgi:hypothetical protein